MNSADSTPDAATNKDSLITTQTNRSKTMSTKYTPNEFFNAETSLERLESDRASYLNARDGLESETALLSELLSTIEGHRAQAEIANREADSAIRAARGKETKEIVELQEMAIRKERQISTVESMIDEQKALVELCQIDAYGARITYTHSLDQARQAVASGETKAQAAALFETEAAAPLMKLLPFLMDYVEDAVYRDEVYMATHGVSPARSGPAKSVKAWLGWDAQRDVDAKVRKEQMAAIGEIVAQHIPEMEDGALESVSEILNPVEPLSCEAAGGDLGSGMALARRRHELAAQVKRQAA